MFKLATKEGYLNSYYARNQFETLTTKHLLLSDVNFSETRPLRTAAKMPRAQEVAKDLQGVAATRQLQFNHSSHCQVPPNPRKAKRVTNINWKIHCKNHAFLGKLSY